MRKVFAVGVVLLGLGLVSIAGAYLYLDFVGKRSWRELESRLRDLGEPLTVADIDPGPISDDENLAAAPIFAEAFEKPLGESRLAKIENFRGVRTGGVSAVAKLALEIDPAFEGTAREAADIVLETAASEGPIWGEVREAARRPRVRWPVDFAKGTAMDVPQLVPMLKLGQSLNAQARSHLARGEAGLAWADLDLLLNLADRNLHPPILISHLVRISMVSLAVDAVADGIELAAWSDGELAAITERLGAFDLVGDLVETLRGERVLSLVATDRPRADKLREAAAILFDDPEMLRAAAVLDWNWARPEGFDFEERASWAAFLQEMIEGVATPSDWPERASDLESKIGIRMADPIQFFRTPISLIGSRTGLPIAKRTMFSQNQIGLAIVACEIERYRLREGRLPMELGGLVPRFIAKMPMDLMSGEVFRYRAVDGGEGYLLYGIGWNQRDDGGSAMRPAGVAAGDGEDWVWGVTVELR